MCEHFIKRLDKTDGAGEIHFQHGAHDLKAAGVKLQLFVKIGEDGLTLRAGFGAHQGEAFTQLPHAGDIAVKSGEYVHRLPRCDSGQRLVDISVQGFGFSSQGIERNDARQALDGFFLAFGHPVEGEPAHQGDADQGQNRQSRRDAKLERKWPVIKSQTLEHDSATPCNPSASIWLSPT